MITLLCQKSSLLKNLQLQKKNEENEVKRHAHLLIISQNVDNISRRHWATNSLSEFPGFEFTPAPQNLLSAYVISVLFWNDITQEQY
jgi:hypothetical protein